MQHRSPFLPSPVRQLAWDSYWEQDRVGIFIAKLGVITGLVALVRTRDQRRQGMAIAAIAVGSVVTVLSLWVKLGSQAV